MIDLAFFFAGLYAATLIVGLLLERVRVPWIFAGLLLGIALAWHNPWAAATDDPAFVFVARLGLHLFLAVIGLSMDVRALWRKRGFLLAAATTIMTAELVPGTLFLHFAFDAPWLTSAVVALSFATVGEAFLLPILEQLRVLRTQLGQVILGIGLVDNLFELLAVIGVSLLIAGRGDAGASAGVEWAPTLAGAATMTALTALALGLPVHRAIAWLLRPVRSPEQVLMGLGLALAFAFSWLGAPFHASALGAVLAGLVLREITPPSLFEPLDNACKTTVYAALGPVLFLWVGSDVSWQALASAPLLVLAQMGIVKLSKIGSALLATHKKLGTRRALFAGVALSVKFSTSIVLVKLLLDQDLIDARLYSVLVASKIGFKFLVPFLLTWMARRWQLGDAAEARS